MLAEGTRIPGTLCGGPRLQAKLCSSLRPHPGCGPSSLLTPLASSPRPALWRSLVQKETLPPASGWLTAADRSFGLWVSCCFWASALHRASGRPCCRPGWPRSPELKKLQRQAPGSPMQTAAHHPHGHCPRGPVRPHAARLTLSAHDTGAVATMAVPMPAWRQCHLRQVS